jgi:molecular chaperone GrpE
MSDNEDLDQQEEQEVESVEVEEHSDAVTAEQLNAAIAENEKIKEQMMYFVAESENFRKRSAKQVADAGKFAVTKFATDLVEVLENLYLATSNVPEELLEENEAVKAIFQGVEMTKSTMLNVFAKHGITRIFPKSGEVFDHNFHEAISYVEQDGFEDNSVVNVMRAGYLLNDRLLKPAVVILAKAAK